MEDTGLPPGQFLLATCGSSFGVADRVDTLREVARILAPDGWFACMWNHRDLEDPLQREIELYIQAKIPDYRYGSRRDDQKPIIESTGWFDEIRTFEHPIRHKLSKIDWLAAWRSHATLQRQAGDRFQQIVQGIATIVNHHCSDMMEIPYITRVWAARLKH